MTARQLYTSPHIVVRVGPLQPKRERLLHRRLPLLLRREPPVAGEDPSVNMQSPFFSPATAFFAASQPAEDKQLDCFSQTSPVSYRHRASHSRRSASFVDARRRGAPASRLRRSAFRALRRVGAPRPLEVPSDANPALPKSVFLVERICADGVGDADVIDAMRRTRWGDKNGR